MRRRRSRSPPRRPPSFTLMRPATARAQRILRLATCRKHLRPSEPMARSDRLTRSRRKYSLPLVELFVARSDRAQRDDGFILVAVLWILGMLAVLISIYAIYVANAAVSLSVNDDRVQAEALVSAALELTAYQLSAVDEKSRPTKGDFAFRMGRSK